MNNYNNYDEFLKSKVRLAQSDGFDCDISEINPALKPHNKLMVKWLVEGGRRACFASFGLHKTVTQLEALRIVLTKTGGRGLIICPLGVRAEFIKDAKNILKWKVMPKFVRRTEECEETGIYLTNYETVRDGKLDPRLFNVASLDEASVLRGFGGSKTFREFMRLFTGDGGPNGERRGTESIKYRFVATATPSPNDYIELLAYADFLGVMDISQAKTRYFKRDSTKADKLTIHSHKEEEFWLWVASWAIFVSKPSDLTGNEEDDKGYILPPLQVHWHEIPSDHTKAGVEKNGQYKAFAETAIGLEGSAKEKRISLVERIAKIKELYSKHEFEVPKAIDLKEQVIDTAFKHTAEYYVLKQLKAGAKWSEAFGDGGASHPVSWMGNSKGITFEVDGKKQAITIKEIQKRADQYKVKHAIFWHDLEDERKAIEKLFPTSKSVFGTQALEIREEIVMDFSNGDLALLAGKPSMLGSGTNLQKYCSWAIYAGIGFKFNDFVQSIHRLLRFGQTGEVRIDLIYTEAERQIRKQLEKKWQQHDLMVDKMTKIIKKYGLSQASMMQILSRKMGIETIQVKGDNFTAVNGDNVKELPKMKSDSVGLIVTSIPFSTQYEYSPNYADYGHSESNEEFFKQMEFSTPEAFRVLMPGRICAVHVKDRITPGGVNGLGFQTTYPFHLDVIEHYTTCPECRLKIAQAKYEGKRADACTHRFAYIGMKTIVTDVVRENAQTYRLGWSEQCKDGSKMGVGMPEYVLLFRKPPSDNSNAYADIPVFKGKEYKGKKGNLDYVECPTCKTKVPESNKTVGDRDSYFCPTCERDMIPYSRSRWQMDAHGFTRSSGDRLLDPEEINKLECADIFKLFKKHSLNEVWDFEQIVSIAENVEVQGKLPSGFMLLQPQSWSEDVWTDITRMRTLNGSQWSLGKEMHICPLQFDIVDRIVEQMSNPGDVVLDYFAGLFTVPLRAMMKGRKGYGIELKHEYFLDGVNYLKAEELKQGVPTLFEALKLEEDIIDA